MRSGLVGCLDEDRRGGALVGRFADPFVDSFMGSRVGDHGDTFHTEYFRTDAFAASAPNADCLIYRDVHAARLSRLGAATGWRSGVLCLARCYSLVSWISTHA